MGYNVDNNNSPAPKKRLQCLQLSPPPLHLLNVYSRIGSVIVFFIGYIRVTVINNQGLRQAIPTKNTHKFLDWFIYLCHMGYIKETLIPDTNVAIEGKAVTLGEYFKYYGIWLLMVTFITSCNRISWFNNLYQLSMWEGSPFGLVHLITGNHFEIITSALRFTIR